LPVDLLERACRDNLNRELIQRSFAKIWPGYIFRELVQKTYQETACKDLAHRPCEENKDLAKRSLVESLNREIPYRDPSWRSLIDTLCG